MMDFLWNWGKTEHERVNEWLSAYLDGELSPQQKERAERHLDTCAACRRDLETLRQTVNLVQQMPSVEIPRSFILTPAQVAPRATRWRTGYVYLRGATAFVTMLFLLIVASDLLWRPRLFAGTTMPETQQVVMEKAVVERPVESEAPRERVTIAEAPRAPTPQVVEKEVVVEKMVKETVVVEREVVQTSEVERDAVDRITFAEPPPAADTAPSGGAAGEGFFEEAPMMRAASEPVSQDEVLSDATITPKIAEEAAPLDSVAEEGLPKEAAATRTASALSHPDVEMSDAVIAPEMAEETVPLIAAPASPPLPTEQIPYSGEGEGITIITSTTFAPIPSRPIPTSTPVETASRLGVTPRRLWLHAVELGLGLIIVILGAMTLIVREKARRE